MSVLQAQRRDRAALAELVHRHESEVTRFLRHPDPAHADDLAQNTWLRVLRRLAGLRDPSRFRPWLFTIATTGIAGAVLVFWVRRAGGR